MKATVLYVSKSGKSALISVEKQFGPITTNISGFVGIPEESKATVVVDAVIDIPATSVEREVRTAENGGEFSFLIFS